MPRSKKPRPSFDVPPSDPIAEGQPPAGWVYRSDATGTTDDTPATADTVNTGRTVDGQDRPPRPPAPNRIVKTYSTFAAGAGLIPMPALDVLTIAALQVKMIAELAAYYGQPFRKDRAKASVFALLGGATSTRLAYGVGGSILKSIPLVGQLGGMLTMPACAAAVTYAVGQVFIQHFESGGTLLEFEPDTMRGRFNAALGRAGASA